MRVIDLRDAIPPFFLESKEISALCVIFSEYLNCLYEGVRELYEIQQSARAATVWEAALRSAVLTGDLSERLETLKLFKGFGPPYSQKRTSEFLQAVCGGVIERDGDNYTLLVQTHSVVLISLLKKFFEEKLPLKSAVTARLRYAHHGILAASRHSELGALCHSEIRKGQHT